MTHAARPWSPSRAPFFLAFATTLAVLSAPAQAQDQPHELLTLEMGSQHEIVVEQGLDRIAVGDEKVAKIVLSRTQGKGPSVRILVSPQAPGSTSLLLWPKGDSQATRYRVEVERRVQTLDQSFPDTPTYLQAARRIEGAGNQGDLVIDRATVDVRSHTVQVDVKIVEFKKSVLKQAGINLFSTAVNKQGFSFGLLTSGSNSSASFNAEGALTPVPTSPLVQAFGLLMNFSKGNIGINLGLLERNGMARVLAEPTLVALSGQSANFLAGGEIPIPVPQGLGTTTIEYKPFGIGLTVSPTVLSNDRIVLKVAPEVSDLDYSNALNVNGSTLPTIYTRRADTTIELGDGESYVIGGLVSRSTTSNIDKVPGIGDIPVLGAFFKRQEYQQNESELVIVVTPTLVRPMARGAGANSPLPGEGSDTPGNPVWRGFLLGTMADSAVPGFSK
jgi:pilus assembly protein CpaC